MRLQGRHKALPLLYQVMGMTMEARAEYGRGCALCLPCKLANEERNVLRLSKQCSFVSPIESSQEELIATL